MDVFFTQYEILTYWALYTRINSEIKEIYHFLGTYFFKQSIVYLR